MSKTLLNKTNGNEKTMYIKKYITTVDENGKTIKTEIEDFRANIFLDNLKELKTGSIAQCMKWEQVEELLNCFDDTEDFQIDEYNGVFYILPTIHSAFAENQFKKALKGIDYIKD